MKFEHRYPAALATDKFEFEYSFVTRSLKLGTCVLCNAYTKWLDVIFQSHACSEECLSKMWKQYKNDRKTPEEIEKFETHFEKIKEEFELASQAREVWKDIVVVVHNQLEYVKECVDSLMATTKNFHLYIWDNGSYDETASYLQGLMENHDPNETRWKITTMRSELNTGFIYPNNELVAIGDSEYVILLNSDTKVFENWDKVLTGMLDKHPEIAVTGAWGGFMGPDGRGFGGGNGYDIDYIAGWCLCIRRSDYNKYGLFNTDLHFAYCEDSDLSLRMKELGHKIYAMHSPLVHHYQNKTIIAVEKEGKIDLKKSFDHNHEYIKVRWKHYLENDRVLLKKRKPDEIVLQESARKSESVAG